MEGIIEVKNVSKVFDTKDGKVEALKGINLSIGRGDIYGIIGMSGAGKSTLVRCLNFLERPTDGTVYVEGDDLASLGEKELRAKRSEIAMIFQHFNLLMQKNVIDNVCFPLIIAGVKKRVARERALELLKIVGLEDKAKSYPAQLSGGQKQRVAIARALAANPKILLCDEATSALDPQTTQSILALLKDINEKYNITIVIITHEMAVVRQVCSHVAILGHGKLVEQGRVLDVFAHPKSDEARELIVRNTGSDVTEDREEIKLLKTSHVVRIVFTDNSSFEPVIANMIMKYNSSVNILRADTRNVGGKAHGEMILGLPDDSDISEQMKKYLLDRGLSVEEVEDYVG